MTELSTLHLEYVNLKISSNLRQQGSGTEQKEGSVYDLDSKDRVEEAFYYLSSKGRDFLAKLDSLLKVPQNF